MRRFNTFLGAGSAAAVLTAGLATAQGIVPDRSTIVTISAPVAVPGVVLPAGEYLFRLADSQTSRNVVQIYDKDRTKIFATLLAIPAERMEPSGEAVITFRESPANQAPALRYWYYAGEKSGQEFAYPKDQAVRIARASGESVMAMDASGDDVDAMQKAEMHRVDANSPEVTAAATSQPASAPSQPATSPAATPAEPAVAPAEPQAATPPAPAVTPAEPATAPTPAPTEPQTPAATEPQTPAVTPAPAEPQAPAATPAPIEPQTPAAAPAQAAPAAPATAAAPQTTATSGRNATPSTAGTSGTTSAASTAAPRELPATASGLPLVGVLGFLALGAAFGARALRRRLVV